MAKSVDDDLFKDSTMSFGEHLDELRVCLTRAVIGLALGSIVGLTFGHKFVHMIERPLVLALKQYYRTQAETDYSEWSASQKEKGQPVPYTLDEVKEIARATVDAPELIYEVKLLHPATIGIGEPVSAAATSAPTSVAPEIPAKADTPETKESESKDEKKETTPAPSRFNRTNIMPVLLWHPLDKDGRINLSALGATEAFSIWIKASLVIGFVLSSPWVFYQIWTFVAAGLYAHERKYVYTFLPMSLGLFFLGVSLAYLFVFAPVLDFLFEYNKWLGINPDPRISEWMSFVLLLPLGFGISFQLPLVMLFLNRIGVFSLRMYLEKWRIAVLVIFILSAVLTPADPYSMLLMAVPLTFLYFGGVLLCRFFPTIKQ